jgi:hypothetical protein
VIESEGKSSCSSSLAFLKTPGLALGEGDLTGGLVFDVRDLDDLPARPLLGGLPLLSDLPHPSRRTEADPAIGRLLLEPVDRTGHPSPIRLTPAVLRAQYIQTSDASPFRGTHNRATRQQLIRRSPTSICPRYSLSKCRRS